MKQVITALFAFLALTLAASAQTKDGKRHHHKKTLMKELNLSDAQKTAAKKNLKEIKQQMLALEKNESITVKEYREQKAALKKAQKEKMLALLTPEQKTKLEGLKQQKAALKQQVREQKLAKQKAKYNLTDEQAAKIKAGMEASRMEMKKIKENSQMGRMEKQEQMMTLKKQRKKDFMAQLSPEQKAKYKELKKERRKETVK